MGDKRQPDFDFNRSATSLGEPLSPQSKRARRQSLAIPGDINPVELEEVIKEIDEERKLGRHLLPSPSVSVFFYIKKDEAFWFFDQLYLFS